MSVYEMLTKSLEDAEIDIYHATDVAVVEELRRKALADIHGAEKAKMLSEFEVESWKKRITEVSEFRCASLRWQDEQKN